MVIIYLVLDMHPFGISKTKVLKADVFMASAFLLCYFAPFYTPIQNILHKNLPDIAAYSGSYDKCMIKAPETGTFCVGLPERGYNN